MINVMIVDDHKIIRESIKRLIGFEKDIKVVNEACNGNDCIQKLKVKLPDIILMDINMPDLNGMETLKFLKSSECRSKIIMFTSHREIDFVVAAFNYGVDGYLSKNCNLDDIIKGIRTVYSGFKFVQPNILSVSSITNLDTVDENDFDKVSHLSMREKEVLRLVAGGNINRDIALMLRISEQTVKNHLSNIYRKLDCYDRVQATVFGIKSGLVELGNIYSKRI